MKRIIVEYKGNKHLYETHGKMTFKEWMYGNLFELISNPIITLYVCRGYGVNSWGYPEKSWDKAPMNDSSCDSYTVKIKFKLPETQEETPISNSKKPEQHIHLIYGKDILAAYKLELMAFATEICDKIDALQATRARVPSTYIAKQIEAQQELLAKVIAKLDE